MEQFKPSVGKRIVSSILDFAIMYFVMYLVMLIFWGNGGFDSLMNEILDLGLQAENSQTIDFKQFAEIQRNMMWAMMPMFLICYIYFVNKDIIKGRSIAKHVLDIQIINNKTGLPAGPARCAVRMLTSVLWPVEGLVLLASPHRRLGDFIAGTVAVRKKDYDAYIAENTSAEDTDEMAKNAKPQFWTYIVAIIIPILLVYSTITGIMRIQENMLEKMEEIQLRFPANNNGGESQTPNQEEYQ